MYKLYHEIQGIKEDYKKYIESSNLWKGIISFKSDYLNHNISIKDLEQKMAKEIMPQFLKIKRLILAVKLFK